jgi:CRP-like cAMP-binding protein
MNKSTKKDNIKNKIHKVATRFLDNVVGGKGENKDHLNTIDIELPSGVLFAKIKSGEILGEMSFIENELPIVNAKAIERTHVISIAHDSITERFKITPDFQGRFYKAMSLYLSSRLRNVAAKISHKNSLTNFGREFEQDMNNATLDRIQIAGERFNRLLQHFR